MTGRIIETSDDLAEGMGWLVQREKLFAQAYELTGELPLRRKPEGFAELLSAIVSQQVSVASARAIWGRVSAAGLVTPEAVAAASDDDLRACGLSRPKLRYARALAEADLDFAALRFMPDEKIIAQLVEIPGIGRWTAEIYAMFSLGRADVFAHNDLALQEAARLLFALDTRPNERQMRIIAADWSPWRAVAARLLWAYYRIAKDREGIA
ncbi:MAG: 3-methyladenine DNA glycosylase [Rhodobacteraceae bacterium GWE1_64_9]|nr:MAG: 3-methyladenine DNA glycosylase [Rhodobacteraceae bacterium GWE1_64_9]OHC47341.1 MAG: 3-methyladenine DNA glycosylase [Rhodobacteraceae bacterium GWF1_65_7]HBD90966.1 3-methyladenine DNA glycosylase [Gemmobacter sp.]HBU13503.1 3-methyladenine DNA glycosylase [Gemmobacter sp.]